MNIEKIVKGLPSGFLIGTSTSSHQIEGGNKSNDWHLWETKGYVPIAGDAANFWKGYRDWIGKTASVGNAFRLSIEWSRVEPTKGHFDTNAIMHYRKILRYCKSKGLATVVTLHHFTDPAWLAEKGGWSGKETVKYFCKYARQCALCLGDMVDYWITINEPQVYIGSRLAVVWPDKYGFREALSAMSSMVKAHKESYKVIKAANSSACIGSAQNIQYFVGKNIVGKVVAKLVDTVWNFSFLNRTIHEHDFIGINYYGRMYFPPQGAITNLLNIKPYAQGLLRMLEKFQKKFGKPLMITENGLFSFKEDVRDSKRCGFITDHLSATSNAISSGVDVRGYLHWTLMDNYEWHRGYNVFMGLFTRRGKPKASAAFMKKINMIRRRMNKHGEKCRPYKRLDRPLMSLMS